jgi:hypothetical protein
LTSLQLIKQLSATPTIAAQNAQAEAQGSLDPKIALRANKEVFFFRLVCVVVDRLAHLAHETLGARNRESQRILPAERSRGRQLDPFSIIPTNPEPVLVTPKDVVGQEAHNSGSQCLHVKDLREFCNAG